MKAEVAFRSTDPDVLRAWDDFQTEMRDQHARIRGFVNHVDPDGKLNLHARRNLIPAYFTGDEAPHGWRKQKNGHIFPDKRLKAGKEAARVLEGLRKSAPDLSSTLKGMPPYAMVGNHWYEFGAFEHDGAVYVHWGAYPEDVDLTVWTELKLSEFYAAKEAHETALSEVAA